MRHREVRNNLYEFARGEMDPVQAREVEKHLAACDRCFGELQALKEGIRLLRPQTRRPSDARSETYWRNLALEIDRRVQTQVGRRHVTQRFWERAEWFFLFRRPYAIALASSVAIVVFAAILWFGRVRPDLVEPAGPATLETQAQTVNEELGDYFRRSKILLVGITNLNQAEGSSVDLRVERRVAHQLVEQARMFEDRRMDERSRALIQALEKILIELANMEDRANLPDVELIRTGIRNENMLFKIRMAETQYSQPFTTAVLRSQKELER